MKEIKEYLQELSANLYQLNQADRQDALQFYEEYINDAGYSSKQEIESNLGTPKQLGRKILAEYSLKQDEQDLSNSLTTKRSIKTAWLVVLALLATPATLIIGVILLGVLMTVTFVLLGLLFGALGLFLAAVFLTMVTLYVGIVLLFSNFVVGMFYLSIGLLGLGAIMIIIPIVSSIGRLIAIIVTRLTRVVFNFFKRRKVRG